MVSAKAPNVITYPVIDAINAYENIFNSFSKKMLYQNGEVVTKVKTKYAKEKEMDVVIHEDLEIFYEKDNFEESKLSYNIEMPNKITKIVSASQQLGTLHVYYDGEEIKTLALFLKNDMQFSLLRFFINIILPLTLLALFVVGVLKFSKIIRK